MAFAIPGSGYERRLIQALQILSADLRFAKIDVWEARALLENFDSSVHAFGSLIQHPIDALFPTPPAELPVWIREFNRWIRDLSQIDRTKYPVFETNSHESRWLRFFLSRLRSGKTVFIPEIEDLFLHASGLALPFKNDLDEMTYGDYAKVLLHLLSADAPVPRSSGLLDVVLVELGFAQQVIDALTSKGSLATHEVDLIEICHTSTRVQKPGVTVLLIIGGEREKTTNSEDGYKVVLIPKGDKSAASGWQLSSVHAVFPIFGFDVGEIRMPIEFKPLVILFEGSLPSLPWSIPAPAWICRILPSGSHVEISGDLIAPPSLDAAVDQVTSQTS